MIDSQNLERGMGEWEDGWMGGGWQDGLMSGWVDRWADGWMGETFSAKTRICPVPLWP